MSNWNTITLKEETNIAYLTINRPKALNALNSQVLTDLEEALNTIQVSDTIRVVVITGVGEKSFVAGADISEMASKNELQAHEFSLKGNRVFQYLADLKQPTIAAVNGFALGGGCELALATDIRIAATTAKFGQPEVGLGIIPGFGGTQRLARLVGPGIAKELIFTAKTIDAFEAEKIGLVNHVVSLDELTQESEKCAKQINKNAPLAVRASKEAINMGLNLTLTEGLELEAQLFGSLFRTSDQKNGMAAFLAKEKAVYEGK